MTNPVKGMLLLHKRAGLTSFQTLNACKKAFGTKKVGHAGTLDKFAEGLLLVFVNQATRLVPFFVGLDKVYVATIEFGTETDTLDPSGSVVKTAPVPTLEGIQRALPHFLGTLMQIPPAYSAIHIDGKRAYERVLAGEILDLKPRQVEISKIDFISWVAPHLVVRVACSSGTYIRSFARDIAAHAGSAGHLAALQRTDIGPFHLSDAVEPLIGRESTDWWSRGLFQNRQLAENIPGLPLMDIKPGQISSFQSGRPISAEWFSGLHHPLPTNFSVCASDDFLGIVSQTESSFSYRLVFPKA